MSRRLLPIVSALALPGCDSASSLAQERPPSSVLPAPNAASWAAERRELVLHRARTAAPARVVFVGDSITQGFEEGGAASWRRHLASLQVVNLGCTGDRTEHVLWRLQQAPLDRLQPAHIVLLLGTNNLGHYTSTPTETLTGLVAVIALLQQQCPAATIHVHEVFPRNEPASALRRQVASVNAGLRVWLAAHNLQAWAAARPPLRLHTFGTQLVGGDGNIDPAVMPDGLHLSAASYERWALELLPALGPSPESVQPR